MKTASTRKTLAVAALVFGMAAFSRTSFAADAALPETLSHAGQLNVGVKCDAPPAAFLNAQGKPEGIDVDFARYIAKNAFGDPGKAVFTCVTSATRMQMLISGKVDLVIATMSPTDERKRVVDFADSTNWGASGVLVRRGEQYNKLEDFNGKTLLSMKGGWQAQYVRKNYPDIHLVLLDSMNDAITALQQHRADGLTEDVKALLPAVARDPDMQLSNVSFGISWGAPAVRRGDDGLRNYVNRMIAQARQDGTFEQAVKKFTSGRLQEAVLNGYLTAPPDGSSSVNTVLR
ncbi:amino acid ABC transporter substrate-binding protein [Caballeronia pedi]|uniref:Amino acid ABC transporter substrate-binding protein n=1 Tax=Caballeronia pedi TaxID=1777141 RepID=A0A158DRN2_9BURK|nr:transporter substrate-binding domain-containing protein [Caballeronia pedi]SAK97281.1 amino acid ABC transporter substrate-binding protein [Caballeronia pedi]